MGKASRRRKGADHGSGSSRRTRTVRARPFEGLPGETDWVAMREILPAATASVSFAKGQAPEGAGPDATVATVLPLAWPGLHRADGTVFVGTQSGLGLRRRVTRPRPRPRGRGHRRGGHPGPRRPTAATARQPATAGPARPVLAARGDRARRLRLLGRRQRPRRRGEGLARARQRVGHPDREDVFGHLGLLVPDRRAHPHPARAAGRRGPRHRRAGPAARGGREPPR